MRIRLTKDTNQKLKEIAKSWDMSANAVVKYFVKGIPKLTVNRIRNGYVNTSFDFTEEDIERLNTLADWLGGSRQQAVEFLIRINIQNINNLKVDTGVRDAYPNVTRWD